MAAECTDVFCAHVLFVPTTIRRDFAMSPASAIQGHASHARTYRPCVLSLTKGTAGTTSRFSLLADIEKCLSIYRCFFCLCTS
eukprot:6455219-Amphidinium_carterae.1